MEVINILHVTFKVQGRKQIMVKCTFDDKIKVKVTIVPKATIGLLLLRVLKSETGSVNSYKMKLGNISSAHNFLDHFS